jgi:hypothetical protein
LDKEAHSPLSFEAQAAAFLQETVALWAAMGAPPGCEVEALVHLRPGVGPRYLVATPPGRGLAALSRRLWPQVAGARGPFITTAEALVPEAPRRGEARPRGGQVVVVPLAEQEGPAQGFAALVLGPGAALPEPELERMSHRWAQEALGWAPALCKAPSGALAELRNDPLLPVAGAATRSRVATLETFARLEETILLFGPTGAGKSRLAEWCHVRSGRTGAFQSVDLMSVPDELQLAELFGWRRGSFTGAHADRDGYIAACRDGTLFIDEIDKLSLKAQAGLLQLLETGRFRPLGESGPLVDARVRFIVGTNQNLAKAVAERRFREDLFYRINVFPVDVPGLDARKDELEAWAHFMLNRVHQRAGREGRAHISVSAAADLTETAWPGNLRQLDNVLRRAYAFALMDHPAPRQDVVVHARHLARALGFDVPASPALLDTLREAARSFFQAARQRAEAGAPLGLEDTQAFAGLVLEEGVRTVGDLRSVYEIFGADHVVRARNHQRDYRRQQRQVRNLLSRLDADASPETRAQALRGEDAALS